jgi:hypothetical protein
MIIFEMVVSLIIQFGVIVIKVVLIQPYLFFNLMICNFFQGCNALLIAALSFVN